MGDRTRDPLAKQEALLEAAIACFTEAGFDGSSAARIAERADVSEGIIFHHFGSKHGLLEACARREAERFIDSEMPRHRPAIDYERLAASIFEWVAADRMTRRLWTEGDDRIVAALRRGWRAAIVKAVATGLVDEQRVGRCRAGDTELLARMQFAVVGEALVSHFDDPEIWPRPVAVAETARVVRSIVDP